MSGTITSETAIVSVHTSGALTVGHAECWRSTVNCLIHVPVRGALEMHQCWFFFKVFEKLFMSGSGCAGPSLLLAGFLKPIAVLGLRVEVASLVAELRLWTTDKFSSWAAWAPLLRSVRGLPSLGIEHESPALAGRFSTTGLTREVPDAPTSQLGKPRLGSDVTCSGRP